MHLFHPSCDPEVSDGKCGQLKEQDHIQRNTHLLIMPYIISSTGALGIDDTGLARYLPLKPNRWDRNWCRTFRFPGALCGSTNLVHGLAAVSRKRPRKRFRKFSNIFA
jgi:hypothetical protein